MPDDSQYLQHYASPAYRGSAQGTLSFSLTQSFPTESFAQNTQETNPEGCEAEGRLECLPDVKDVEEDSDVALYVSRVDDGEAQIVKKDAVEADESEINNVLHGGGRAACHQLLHACHHQAQQVDHGQGLLHHCAEERQVLSAPGRG